MGRISLSGNVGNLFDILTYYGIKSTSDNLESEVKKGTYYNTYEDFLEDRILCDYDFKDSDINNLLSISYSIVYKGTNLEPISLIDNNFDSLEEAVKEAKKLYVERDKSEGIWQTQSLETIEMHRPILIVLKTFMDLYKSTHEIRIQSDILAGEICKKYERPNKLYPCHVKFNCYNYNTEYDLKDQYVEAWMYTSKYPSMQAKAWPTEDHERF